MRSNSCCGASTRPGASCGGYRHHSDRRRHWRQLSLWSPDQNLKTVATGIKEATKGPAGPEHERSECEADFGLRCRVPEARRLGQLARRHGGVDFQWWRVPSRRGAWVPPSRLPGTPRPQKVRSLAPAANAPAAVSGTAGSVLPQSFGTRMVRWCRGACRVQRGKSPPAPGSQKQPSARP
jgi:hypothetical protein